MTVVHAVIILFTVPPTEVEQSVIRAAAESMVSSIPQIKKLSCGFDLGLKGSVGQGSFSIVAEFTSGKDYETYKNHATHLEFVATHLKPRMASRTATQFMTGPQEYECM